MKGTNKTVEFIIPQGVRIMKVMKVKLVFLEELLGTSNADPDIHAKFIASKGPDAATLEEEIEALGVDEVTEKGITIFPRDEDGDPMLWDYQVKGFFKDACSMLRRINDTKSKKLKAYKKIIDGLIFVEPRKIKIDLNGGVMGNCQRPLRASTAQGERIALAHSEAVPVGSFIEFEITLLDEAHEKAVVEWLDYGRLRGLGQWRNSGKGRFKWEEVR